MLNLAEKFTTEAVEADEDGVVAIEYVVVAGVTVTALLVLWSTGVFTALNNKLQAVIGNIPS
jgi:Flp pilus assembly pilin Flp